MKQLNILGLGLLVIGFSGCQVKVEEIASVAAEPESTIVGIWSTACIEDFNDSYIRSFEVKDDTMTIATLKYMDNRFCDQATLGATILPTIQHAVRSIVFTRSKPCFAFLKTAMKQIGSGLRWLLFRFNDFFLAENSTRWVSMGSPCLSMGAVAFARKAEHPGVVATLMPGRNSALARRQPSVSAN